jgi:hypothetical protein
MVTSYIHFLTSARVQDHPSSAAAGDAGRAERAEFGIY